MRFFLYGIMVFFVSAHAQLIKVPTQMYGETNPSIRDLKRNHPGHYPFISHLTFRNMCDIIIDDFIEWFDPESVKHGDTIYLNIWYLDWFVEKVHDHIRNPYILVTCDVGNFLPFAKSIKLLYDPKCAAWFGRNMIFSYHPKLIQIPMGQDHALFSLEKGPEDLVAASAKIDGVPKKHLLYMNHLPRSWGDRDKIIKLFEKAPYCFSRNRSDREYAHVSLRQYYDDLLSSQFVLSPLGLETDCVRTWEALALNCIPVIEHTFLDPLFKDMPVVFVHNWDEIDESFLQKKYEELKNLPISERVYFDYWSRKIKDTQAKIRNQDMGAAQLDALLFDMGDLADLSGILEGYSMQHDGTIDLFFRGNLSAMRAMQLAYEQPCISRFCLHDVWLNKVIWHDMQYAVADPRFVSIQAKIGFIDTEESFNVILNYFNEAGMAVFLDLSYYRHSLYWDLNNHRRLRHSLKTDIQQLSSRLAPGVMVCGNMRSDPFVEEVLEQLSNEYDIALQVRGNFWFFIVTE